MADEAQERIQQTNLLGEDDLPEVAARDRRDDDWQEVDRAVGTEEPDASIEEDGEAEANRIDEHPDDREQIDTVQEAVDELTPAKDIFVVDESDVLDELAIARARVDAHLEGVER